LKIITAEDITDSTLTSSSVPETDHAAWSSGTTYALDDYVIVTTPNIHKIYKSKQNSNLNNDPVTDTTATWWSDEGSTNRWKMFNTTVQQQTLKSGGFNVVITPAAIISGLSVVNADCESITVLMVDPVEGTIWNETYSMISDSGITSWYDYFFTPITRDSDLAVLGLPPYANAVLTVTFTGSGDVKCGALVIGVAKTIGISQYGASFGIMDYSTKSTDSAGNVSILAGSFSDTVDVDVIIETPRFAEVKKILTDARSVPSVWVVEEDTDGLIVYGYFREFSILMTNPTVSLTTLSIEGLN
tara:strand:- start:471 stop:1373 length:903 start_codon:yes stop_codon:yes gene_type:complete